MNYVWHCEDPDCGSVRESDTLAHGKFPCGKCKKKMVIADRIGYRDGSEPEGEDPLEM